MRAVVREQFGPARLPSVGIFVSKYGEWVCKPDYRFRRAVVDLAVRRTLLGVIVALWVAALDQIKKTKISKRSVSVTADTARLPYPDIEGRILKIPARERSCCAISRLNEAERAELISIRQTVEHYQTLKQEIESKGGAVMQQLGALPAEPAVKTPKERPPRASEPKSAPAPERFRRWQLITGGVFLLLFGLALGVILTQSIRPRGSENDTITGDFMTGTTPATGNVRAALDEGKQAFEKQDFPRAIDAFKKALAADPNNPEAHAYMGFILVQAGHGDGALMAFDKALAAAPNFPMALWGKGMVLYQEKKDYAGAREVLEKVLNLMPPGEERNEIAKVLMEIPAGSGQPTPAAAAPTTAKAAPSSSAQITGTVTIDPKLKSTVDPNAALFIIARPAGGAGGPPLAVKKIDKPAFPLTYSLSQENVMMQGTPFTGRVSIFVRLDKDANPVTRTVGDLTGEYKKNPVEVGTKDVNIILDQVAE
jgi:tetratricopeptide (TPR) repeat protein